MHTFNISKYKSSVVCVHMWKCVCERMCVCATVRAYRLNVESRIPPYVTVHLIFQIDSLTKPITHSSCSLDWLMSKPLWLVYFCSFIFHTSRYHGHLSSYGYWWTKLDACPVNTCFFHLSLQPDESISSTKTYTLNFMHYQLMP